MAINAPNRLVALAADNCRLFAWVALQSGQSPDTRYETPLHAAVALEPAADCRPATELTSLIRPAVALTA
jgi:hypothetical protein